MKKDYELRPRAKLKAAENKKTHFGPTPIIEKVKAGKNGAARRRLRQTINSYKGLERLRRVNEQDVMGNTPLHHAVANRDELAVRMLIQKGARLDIQNREGLLPSDFAMKTNFPQLAVSLYRLQHSRFQAFMLNHLLHTDHEEGLVGNLIDFLMCEDPREHYKAYADYTPEEKQHIGMNSGYKPIQDMADRIVVITAVIDKMTRDQALTFLAKLMHYPQYAQQAIPSMSLHGRLEFFDTGRSFETWSYMADALLKKIGSQQLTEDSPHADAMQHTIRRAEKVTKPQYENIQDFLKSGEYHYLRLQGRTILLKNNFKDEIIAFKVQKHHESVEELAKQAGTVDYLTRHKDELGLKSDIPKSEGVMHIRHIKHWLINNPHVSKKDKAAFEKLATVKNPAVYVYRTSSAYFKYLHQLRGDKLEKAIRTNLHDLFILDKHGIIYDQLADMFHTNLHQDIRPDSGRYLPLVNLVRKMNYRGAGRITAYLKAIEFLNMRQSGVADEGDHTLLKDVIEKPHFRQARERHGTNVGVYVLANQLAEQLLVADLGAGYANRKTAGSDNHAAWQRTCDDIIAGVADAVGVYANTDRDMIERNLRLGLFDGEAKTYYADQNRMWMTDDYIPYVNQNRLPPVYESYVEDLVENEGLREGSYSKEKGCAIDGVNPDIGAVNGVDPRIKGAELRTWAPVMAIGLRAAKLRHDESMAKAVEYLSENKFNNAQRQLDKAEGFRPNTDRVYHLRRAVLEKKADSLAGKRPMVASKIEAQMQANERNHAANVIQRFWHEHKRQEQVVNRKRTLDDTASSCDGPVAKRLRTKV